MWLKLAEKLIKESLSAQYHLRGLDALDIPMDRRKIFEIIKRKGATITLFHTMKQMPFPIEELDNALQNQTDPRRLNMLSTKLLGSASNEGRTTAHEQVFFTTRPAPVEWLTNRGSYVQLVFEVPIADLLETQILIFGPRFERWLIEKYDYNNEKLNEMDTDKMDRESIISEYQVYFGKNIDQIINEIKSVLKNIGTIELTTLNILPMRYLLGIIEDGHLTYTNPNKSTDQLLNILTNTTTLQVDENNTKVNQQLSISIKTNNKLSELLSSNNDINIIKYYILQMSQNNIKIKPSLMNKIMRGGHIDLISFILDNRIATIDSNSLYYAILSNNKYVVKKVIELGVQPDEESLDDAFRTMDIDIIKMILDLGAKHTNNTINTAIFCSEHNNDPNFVRIAIEAGTPVSSQSLLKAIDTQMPELVKLILDNMNLSLIPYYTFDITLKMFIRNQTDNGLIILEILKNYGLKASEKDLISAINSEYIDAVRICLEAGAPVSPDLIEWVKGVPHWLSGAYGAGVVQLLQQRLGATDVA